MWDAAGFLFCMPDKSSAALPSIIIIQPLVLFNAIKDFAISVANYAVLTAYFLTALTDFDKLYYHRNEVLFSSTAQYLDKFIKQSPDTLSLKPYTVPNFDKNDVSREKTT